MTRKLSALAITTILSSLAAVPSTFAVQGSASDWQTGLQDAASPIAASMHRFNNMLLVIIIGIVILVMGLLGWVMFRYRESANPTPSRTSHNTLIEVVWTVVPVLVLVVIAIPSFRLLFQQFDFQKPDVIVKVTGKQWFWSYEYPDFKNVSFDSLMVDEKDLKDPALRTLAVDNEMVVPVNKRVEVLITGADVIHEWVVPAFGSRADAFPGRVNRSWFIATEPGVYYGQCSALCGQGHSYMPIAVRVVSEEDFKNWIAQKQKTAELQSMQKVAHAE